MCVCVCVCVCVFVCEVYNEPNGVQWCTPARFFFHFLRRLGVPEREGQGPDPQVSSFDLSLLICGRLTNTPKVHVTGRCDSLNGRKLIIPGQKHVVCPNDVIICCLSSAWCIYRPLIVYSMPTEATDSWGGSANVNNEKRRGKRV